MSENRGLVSIAIVCEANDDRIIACDLADRVIRAELNLSEERRGNARRYRGYHEHDSHLSWIGLAKLQEQNRLRIHGHFLTQHGFKEPGSTEAWQSRRALLHLHGTKDRP